MAASIPDRSLPEKVQLKLKRHGTRSLVHDVCMRAINKVVPFRILRGVVVEKPAPAYLAYPAAYSAGFLTEPQLRGFATDAENELSAAFLDSAGKKGDECYAILDGTNLAAYGWYAKGPTPVGPPNLFLRFSSDYVYMYKGFTGMRYRGKRLHAIGMTRALQAYRERGFRGLVSYVESTNFDSLKSCERMGYRIFGSIYLVTLFGREFAFSGPGCRAFDFRLETRQ